MSDDTQLDMKYGPVDIFSRYEINMKRRRPLISISGGDVILCQRTINCLVRFPFLLLLSLPMLRYQYPFVCPHGLGIMKDH